MIDVSGIDKPAFAKAVYALSGPQGMGIMHAKTGALDDETAEKIAGESQFHMDYIRGRACKMSLQEKDGKLWAPDTWYDHTDEDYAKLLAEFGFVGQAKVAHGCTCNCESCKSSPENRYPGWGLKQANVDPVRQ